MVNAAAPGAVMADLRVVLASEQYVDHTAGAFERLRGHKPAAKDGASFRRTTDETSWRHRAEAEAAARAVAENTHIYQEWFNDGPFAGQFDYDHVTAFLEALPMIREANGYNR